MTRTLAAAALALAVMASTVMADEHRGGDAALGALSGAVVLGPVGAVAGAVVGYAAGPSIARSWGFRRPHAARQARKPVGEAHAEVPLPTPRAAAISQAAAQPAPPSQAPAAPPVQTLE
jgi:hypothetical protein